MPDYPLEVLGEGDDDGTMPRSREELEQALVGHRIVNAQQHGSSMVLTLDNNTRVQLVDSNDCCAYTEIQKFLLHPDKVDHVITGVGTTDGYSTWHIYADMGDILELTVGWSAGNPFWYAYGFDIQVEPVSDGED